MQQDRSENEVAVAGMAKNRVEALVDGIFGVAMTLLVLDVKIPQDLPLTSEAALLERLNGLTGNFRIYLISFVVLGMYWIAHHMQFHLVRMVDRAVLWINLSFLLGITLVPFSTSLLGEYGYLKYPAIIYGLNLLWLALMYWIQVAYLERHPHLASAALTREAASLVKRRLLLLIVVPLLSMLAALFDPWIAVHLYVLLIALAFLPGKRPKPGRAAPHSTSDGPPT